MNSEALRLVRTDSDDPVFRELVKMLDADLLGRYGDQQAFFDQFNKLDKIKHVVVAWMDELPVGCGAFKAFDDHSVELKRMFVRSDQRGKKIGLFIINELEKWASELGFSTTVLETGTSQPEAIRLYQNAGYTGIDNYGPYAGNESSVCMKKEIGELRAKDQLDSEIFRPVKFLLNNRQGCCPHNSKHSK